MRTAKLADGAVVGAKVADDTLTGGKIIDGTINVNDLAANSVTGSKVADNSLTGADIREDTLNYGGAGCKAGLVHSFALIRGSDSMPTTWTTSNAFVSHAHNCSGGTVEVRRQLGGDGQYAIRFNGDPSVLAVATMQSLGDLEDNVVAIKKFPENFAVTTQGEHANVVVMTF